MEKIGYTCVLQPKLNCRAPVTGSKQRAGLGVWSLEGDGNGATDKAIKRLMQGPERFGARRGQQGNPAGTVTDSMCAFLIPHLHPCMHTYMCVCM